MDVKNLYPHQQRIVDLNPKKYLLNWEMRVGKSFPASLWVDHPCRNKNTYIITLKKNKKSWQAFNTNATVLTKEEFKKKAHTIKNPTAIVIDEIHYFASGLFIKGRSQLSTSLYKLLQAYPECDVLGLSATMLRQNAWSFHTILCYIGVYYPWKEWRKEFFELRAMPFLRFPAWFPKRDWRKRIQKYVKQHTDIVSLKDVIDDLPPATARIITIKQKKYIRPIDRETTWVDEHRYEQQGKINEILGLGYKKIILVVKYTNQIDELAEQLKDEKPIFILDGRTKDQETIIKQAQESEDCYFIVQASCGEAWDGWQFGVMVFVSMEHGYVSNVQMHGRQRHPKNLRDIEIIYLVGGRWDKKILEAFMAGQNFNPHKA